MPPSQRAYEIGRSAERQLRLAFEESVDEWADDLELDEVSGLIAFGDIGALQELYVEDAVADVLDPLIAAIFAMFVMSLGEAADELDTRGGSVLDAPYRDWILARQRQLAVDMSRQAEENLRGILRRGFAEGASDAELARRVRDELWLLPAHAAAVDALRASMLAAGVAAPAVARAVDRAIQRYMAYRAKSLAITEIHTAINQARRLLWQELQRRGAIPATAMVIWWTVEDERRCPECAALHGERVPVGQRFSGGLESPPAHPACRCRILLDKK